MYFWEDLVGAYVQHQWLPPFEIDGELRMSRPTVFSSENRFGVSQAWGQLYSQKVEWGSVSSTISLPVGPHRFTLNVDATIRTCLNSFQRFYPTSVDDFVYRSLDVWVALVGRTTTPLLWNVLNLKINSLRYTLAIFVWGGLGGITKENNNKPQHPTVKTSKLNVNFLSDYLICKGIPTNSVFWGGLDQLYCPSTIQNCR